MSTGPISSSLSSAFFCVGYTVGETFPLRELNFSLLVAIALSLDPTELPVPTEREYFPPQHLQKALFALLELIGLACIVCFPFLAVPVGR